MKKRIKSYVYTKGKFGKGYRETCDTENPFLYSEGRYPTKITAEDLPEDYLEIRSRVIWYMTGYLKTSGIVDMKYKWAKLNHLFKDDYIYISYKEPLRMETDSWGFKDYVNYDVCVCGNSIVDIVLAAEKYSNFDTTEVRAEIEKKRVWLRDNKPDYYAEAVGEDEDIFTLWKRKGYI
ncbi:MAG: hypothetical protein HUJ56_07155 [Erysipelotrichaceae bacterium]|nr:hypothetical protein [Erysipelotrichaceae bacterium]